MTSEIIGTTEELDVVVYGKVAKLKFLIIENDDHDALLGLDWFMVTGAGICPADGTLRFPEKIVYLQGNKKDIGDYDGTVEWTIYIL